MMMVESPLNTPLNRTPVRKTNRPASGERHEKDSWTDSSGHSSGHTTPRLQHRDLETLYSISDSESSSYKASRNRKSSNNSPSVEFLHELTEGYDSMNEELCNTKEMLQHLQQLVSQHFVIKFKPVSLASGGGFCSFSPLKAALLALILVSPTLTFQHNLKYTMSHTFWTIHPGCTIKPGPYTLYHTE